MRKIYIAHPLRGENREKNVEETARICRKITELFPEVLPVSPIHAFSFLEGCGPEGDEKALELCLELMKSCDEAWFFGEWGKSEGCMEEERTFKGPMSFFSPEACAELKENPERCSRMGTRPLIDWLAEEVYAGAEPPLKPCPFCGDEARVKDYVRTLGKADVIFEGEVICDGIKCPARCRITWRPYAACKTRAEAIAAWNRRVW